MLWSSWKRDISLAAPRSPRLDILLCTAMFPGRRWGHGLARAQGEEVLVLGRGWVPPSGAQQDITVGLPLWSHESLIHHPSIHPPLCPSTTHPANISECCRHHWSFASVARTPVGGNPVLVTRTTHDRRLSGGSGGRGAAGSTTWTLALCLVEARRSHPHGPPETRGTNSLRVIAEGGAGAVSDWPPWGARI